MSRMTKREREELKSMLEGKFERYIMVQGYVSSATEKGARSYQEDRFVVIRHKTRETEGWLLGVMDGHGGVEVAEFCEKNIENYFKILISKPLMITDVLRELIRMLNEKLKHMNSGSTVSLVYIHEANDRGDAARAFVAILGDSPVMIKARNGDLVMSREHNTRTNLADRKVAIQRGAVYSGGYIWDDPNSDMRNGLQLTRALGDSALDKFLNREPEVYFIDLGPESFVAVMSDGVVDPKHKDHKDIPGNLASIISNGGTAADLVNDALKRQTGDNVTVVLWKAIENKT